MTICIYFSAENYMSASDNLQLYICTINATAQFFILKLVGVTTFSLSGKTVIFGSE